MSLTPGDSCAPAFAYRFGLEGDADVTPDPCRAQVDAVTLTPMLACLVDSWALEGKQRAMGSRRVLAGDADRWWVRCKVLG
jgi:hypothetical protein